METKNHKFTYWLLEKDGKYFNTQELFGVSHTPYGDFKHAYRFKNLKHVTDLISVRPYFSDWEILNVVEKTQSKYTIKPTKLKKGAV